MIYVSGDLGASYMGLQLLEREKAVFDGSSDFQPDFAGKEYLLERQLKPEARRDVVALLKEHGILPTSMIDISDGLSSDLLHICKQSNTGCQLYEERLPIDYQTAVAAEMFNMNEHVALNGGSANCSLPFLTSLEAMERQPACACGSHDRRAWLPPVTRDGQECACAQGWEPIAGR